MKHILFVCSLLFLASCIKKQENANLDEGRILETSKLESTLTKSEEEIARVAEAQLKARISMPAVKAEQCWNNESTRPKVRDTCLLLWGIGNEQSKILEAAVVNGVSNSPFLAAILLLRHELIAHIPFADLLRCLANFEGSNNFYKVKLAKLWLNQKSNHINREQIETLLQGIQIKENDAPITLRELSNLYLDFDPGRWSALFQRYCPGQGEAKIRCWRYLSLFANDMENNLNLRIRLLPYWPRMIEPEWKLFVRSFPNQARKIQIHTN